MASMWKIMDQQPYPKHIDGKVVSPINELNNETHKPEDECERLQKAPWECHRRVQSGPGRDSVCRHLNHDLAKCLVSIACPKNLNRFGPSAPVAAPLSNALSANRISFLPHFVSPPDQQNL